MSHHNIGARIVLYVAGTCFAAMIAFSVGVGYFDSICDEDDPEVTECDLGGLYGLVSSFWTVVGCLVAVLVIELALAARRRRQRLSPSPTARPPGAR